MVTGLAHVAITVGDMERSLAFYRDMLGFPVKRTLDATGGAKIIMLDIAGRGELELFLRPRTKPLPEGSQDPEAIGLKHFALEVEDVERAWGELEARGVKTLGRPLFRQPGGARVCHFLDPDGVVVELMERAETWWPGRGR